MWGLLFVLLACLSAGEDTFGCPKFPPTVAFDIGQLAPVFAKVTQIVNNAATVENVSVAIVYDQQIIFTKGSVASSAIFRIGSISKVFTSLLVWQAHQEGILALDDPVEYYFPVVSEFQNRWATTRSFSWRDLISHRAGLAREVPCEAIVGHCNVTLTNVLEIVKNWPAVCPIASRPSYSNLGFALAGGMMANLYGQPDFAELMRKKVLVPLNMTNSGFVKPSNSVPIVPGYLGSRIPDWAFGFADPAAGMYSTVADLGNLVKMLFRDEVSLGEPDQLLDGTLMREWLSPVFVGGGFPTLAFGAPWEMTLDPTLNNTWVRGKAGGLLGYDSQLSMIPELKLGVVVLVANGPGGGTQLTSTQLAVQTLSLVAPAIRQILQSLIAPAPPSSGLLGSYRGRRLDRSVPISASGIEISMSALSPLPLLSLWGVLEGTNLTLAQGVLAMSGPISNTSVAYYRLLPPSTESCAQLLDGGEQFVSRNLTDGSLRIAGLFFYSFVFEK